MTVPGGIPGQWAETSLDELTLRASELSRRHFPPEVLFAAPSQKHYDTGLYRNARQEFRTISVTGKACALHCDHCGMKVLEGMAEARTPSRLADLGIAASEEGARGVLVSGGCLSDGSVPLESFLEDIGRLVESGLTVLVHTGLVRREVARGLKRAGVHQVLLDILGDEDTIRQVYHLDRPVAAYREAMRILREEGLAAVPHVVVGLHYGQIRGEWEALRIIREEGASQLVVVVLQPLPGTEMASVPPVAPDDVGRVLAVARLMMPEIPISLGCAKPAGSGRRAMERHAVDIGVQSIAYPLPETVRYASERGLQVRYHEQCCSVLGV